MNVKERSHNKQKSKKKPSSKLIFEIRKIKNKKKWTKEEDKELINLARKYKEKQWKEISKNFSKKNALQCFSRYKRIRPGIVKGSWNPEEDQKILDLMEIYGKSWSKISKILSSRNGKQIRDRFINVLDPEIKKGKFTDEEDELLVRLYLHYGPKWSSISKYFEKRTADMIKNRFHSSIKKIVFNDKTGKNIKYINSILAKYENFERKLEKGACSGNEERRDSLSTYYPINTNESGYLTQISNTKNSGSSDVSMNDYYLCNDNKVNYKNPQQMHIKIADANSLSNNASSSSHSRNSNDDYLNSFSNSNLFNAYDIFRSSDDEENKDGDFSLGDNCLNLFNFEDYFTV